MGSDSLRTVSGFKKGNLGRSFRKRRGRTGVLVRLTRREPRRLMRLSRKTRDAREKRRVQTVLLREKGWIHREIAEALGCESVTVGRVLKRWQEHGEAGLVDRREDNGPLKVDEDHLQCLREILGNTPRDYGWARPTWTLESLVLTVKRLIGISVSPSTMSRALWRIGARRGRPKPVVACPWTQRKRKRRLREIHRLLLCVKIIKEYPEAKGIHLVLDNCRIHKSRKSTKTRIALFWN